MNNHRNFQRLNIFWKFFVDSSDIDVFENLTTGSFSFRTAERNSSSAVAKQAEMDFLREGNAGRIGWDDNLLEPVIWSQRGCMEGSCEQRRDDTISQD